MGCAEPLRVVPLEARPIRAEVARHDGGMKFAPLAAILSLSAASVASAQGATPAPTAEDVVVTGVREGTIDLKRLLNARSVFNEGRTVFAPGSSLTFQLRRTGGLAIEGMTLTLREGERAIPVPIDEQGRFALPDPSRGTWELVHNRGKARVAVRALVLSPGATVSDRPLGDLRLQCRVSWELLKPTFSIFARTGFGALGGCSSSRFAFYFNAPRPIAAATVRIGPESLALPLGADRASFRAPLSDRALPNAARVQVRYVGD